MKKEIPEKKITDLSSFVKFIESFGGLQFHNYDFIYRGQRKDKGWSLVPKIARNKNGSIIKPNEIIIIDHGEKKMNLIDYKEEFIDLLFSTRLPSFEFNVNTYIEKLIIAQHYGLQTRLLDFTTNPLVALFFAVFKETDSDNSVVWFIQINPKRYRLFRDLKKAKPNDINETILFHPPFIDKRIQSQNSIFVYFKKPYQPLDHQYDFFGNNISYNAFTNKDDDFFSKNVDSKIIKIMIPNKCRKDLCHSLITIGIDYEKLFPDIIGSVNHINWRLDYSIR